MDMSHTVDFTLDFIPSASFTGDAPEAVKITVTHADAMDWVRLANLVKTEKLLSVERFDSRCRFVFNNEEVDTPVDQDIDFNPDYERLEIQCDGVAFLGELKHGGTEESWMTRTIPLADLRDAFAISA